MTPRRAARSGILAQGLEYAKTNPLVLLAVALGLIARIVYWQATERRFEDGLITVAHAVNAADGNGLTHHSYEPVTHGFTTVVSVLTPLVGELIGELWSYVDGFLVLRLAGLATFVLTVVLADRICRRVGSRRHRVRSY